MKIHKNRICASKTIPNDLVTKQVNKFVFKDISLLMRSNRCFQQQKTCWSESEMAEHRDTFKKLLKFLSILKV